MRTYILLLCAALLVSSCGKDKTEPEPMATELPDSFNGELNCMTKKVTEVDSAGQSINLHQALYLASSPLGSDDLGAPTLNGTTLIALTNYVDPTYGWPDQNVPVESPATWVFPENSLFSATTITDPTTFSEIVNFPDTIKLSEDFKVTFTHAGWATISLSQAQNYPINFAVSAYNSDTTEVTLNKVSAAPAQYPSRVYISVTVTNTFTHSNNKATFYHERYMGKWVKVMP